MSANTLWYRPGTVSVTNQSNIVNGVGTGWTTAGINPGATFRIDGQPYALEVKRVISDTQLELVKPYYGTSASGLSYSIDRNFQSTLPAKMSADVTDLVGIFQQIRDGVYLTIEGKSAYQVAVENGYSGTVSQWLESLKGAGDYTVLRNELEPYRYNNAGAHNAHFRGKHLGGALTDAQSSAIRNGTFADIYVGDYWQITVPAYSWTDLEGTVHNEASCTVIFRVADLDYYLRCGDSDLLTHHLVIVPDGQLYTARMNAENKTEGGYVNSEMRVNNLLRAKALIIAAFGESHVLSHRILLTNAVKDGKPSAGTWCDSVVDLMNEPMVYGSYIHAPANDGVTIPYRYTESKSQLALFRHRPDLISSRQWYWLRDVVNSAYFAYVSDSGCAGHVGASNVGGVRPAFLIY